MSFDDLDIAGRAEMLGLSCREFVAFAQRDPRIVASPSLATAGAVVRLKRWLAAGSPEADLSRLTFCGPDDVREILIEVLATVPTPVAWHGVEHVAWIEVGSSARAWQAIAPSSRTPADDLPHMIALCGHDRAEGFAAVVAHELGHSWSRPVQTIRPSQASMSELEWAARAVIAAKICGVTVDGLVRERVAFERLADDLARLWGFARASDYALLTLLFASKHAAAADLAEQIEQKLDADTDRSGAHLADRAAATHAG